VLSRGDLSIGDLSAATGVPTTTLRHYDRIGLLVPGRDPGGRRRYPPRAIEVLRLIRLLRAVGCSLEEVAVVLAPGPQARDARTALASRKLDEARRRLTELTAVEAVLGHLATCLHEEGQEEVCRSGLIVIIQNALDSNGT
jgi:DNA-binding transcriptional MerR regulator